MTDDEWEDADSPEDLLKDSAGTATVSGEVVSEGDAAEEKTTALSLDEQPDYETSVYPDELLNVDQWLNWASDQDRKIPRAPWRSGDKFVSAQDSANWTDFETARDYAEMLPRFGVAFNIAGEGEGWRCTFIDLDDVRDPETESLHPTARRLVEQAESYTQVSTSGTGLHIFVDARLPDGVEAVEDEIPEHEDFPEAEIEVYDKARYAAMPGHHLVGTPKSLGERQAFVDELAEEYVSHAEGTPEEMRSEPELSKEEVEQVETTSDISEVFDAIQHVTPSDIRLRSEVTHERSGREKDLDPAWTTSKSGTRLGQIGDGWVYRKGMVGLDALQVVALEEGIVRDVGQYPTGEEFWKAVDALRERGAHIPEYDSPDESAKPVAAIPKLQHLDEEGRRRVAARGGTDYPTTEKARLRLEDRLLEAIEDGEHLVLDAPTALGKSHTVATQPWRGIDGQPVVHLHATRDARDEAYETSKEHDIKTKRLRGRKEACPVARGDFDPNVGGKDDEECIEVRGTPASEWFDAVCDQKGIPFSTAHKWLDDHVEGGLPCCTKERTYYDKENGEFVEEGGPCPAVAQWENVPRTDEGEPTYDVIHATHAMAHVPSLTLHTNVVFDEQPDFGVSLSQDRVRRAVTAYLQEVDAPVRTWEKLIDVSRNGFSGNEHATPPKSPSDQRAEFLDAVETQPERAWYIEDDDAHVLAPALAKAVYYAEERGNERRAATVPFEPPTLYAHAHDDDDWNRQWLTVVLDEDNTIRSMRNTPSLGLAKSVIGLDAHPAMPLWHRVHPSFDHDAVLDREERRLWRRYERGLRVVQVGDATRPLSGDNAREWFGEDRVRTLVERIDDVHDGSLRTGITSMAAEDLLEDCLAEVADTPETMHYGEEKSRNDFADEKVGLVNGCIDPGDDFVLDLLAELDLDAEPAVETTDDGEEYRAPGRGFVGDDAETAEEILASVRENHVAQAAGRYARDADSDDGAVVYVRTDAMPPGFADEQVPGIAWAFGEKQERIVEYLRDNPTSTAREIAAATDASKRHVQKTLKRLHEDDLVTVREAAAKHGADVYEDVQVDGDGVVDLDGLEITNSDIWDSSMWEFAVSAPSYASDSATRGSRSMKRSSNDPRTSADTSIGDFTG